MKAIIIGADAVIPEIVISKSHLFPTLYKMLKNGAHAFYSGYVQKGYNGSYSSQQNWASIYTGLPPNIHKLNTKKVGGENRSPVMCDFDDLQPFWKVLNENGLSVGLWTADCCASPAKINGYVVSCECERVETPSEQREGKRIIQICEKDRFIEKYLVGKVPPRLYPKTLKQQGYTFEELKNNTKLAEEAVRKYHFQDSLNNFAEELEFFINAMKRAQHEHPVDILYFFTPTTDLIAHCAMYCDNNEILLSAYKLLDRYLGELIDQFNPDITIFLSDHGQQNFKRLVECGDKEIQREAFAARDEVLWLKNGYIAFEAKNGALLFTAHALKGIFIACGKGIHHKAVQEMCTLDIYPTLMEAFGIKVPEGRLGYVVDIFGNEVINKSRVLQEHNIKWNKVAVMQTHSMSVTDIVLNEIYIGNRFSRITVIGESKYKEIFLNNPRVSGFIGYEDAGDALPDLLKSFDLVFTTFFNEAAGAIKHIRIY